MDASNAPASTPLSSMLFAGAGRVRSAVSSALFLAAQGRLASVSLAEDFHPSTELDLDVMSGPIQRRTSMRAFRAKWEDSMISQPWSEPR
jgi:hypothetical protein